VIREMIELTGSPTQLRICDTIREKDGLAMSSRNMRLTADQRAIAPKIYEALINAKRTVKAGDLRPYQSIALEDLKDAGFRPDYFEFAQASSLEIVQSWNGKDPLVVLVAAFLGDIRLIDNMILN
jgi:pantoate--beta-alanine ligase